MAVAVPGCHPEMSSSPATSYSSFTMICPVTLTTDTRTHPGITPGTPRAVPRHATGSTSLCFGAFAVTISPAITPASSMIPTAHHSATV
ncbi:hypothetical protein DSC45_20430 [Streptomyces sp. YIM 130001]|nr:hypothetical protein DSC45_20430 [Streptomyces sp. YIM 130001]